MPDVPKPEELPSEAEIAKSAMLPLMPDPVRRYYERERPIELRPVEYGRYLGKNIRRTASFNVWIRATGKLPDDPRDPPMRARLRVRHDAARHRADRRTAAPCSRRPSWRRASTTRCGCTGRSAPTTGCFMPRTAPTCTAPAGFAARPDLRRPTARTGGLGGAGGSAAASAGRPSLAGCLHRLSRCLLRRSRLTLNPAQNPTYHLS